MNLYIPVILLLTVTVFFLIRAEFAENRKQIHIFKPISSSLLLIIVLLSLFNSGHYVEAYTMAMLGGMVFCMGGDISLMFMDNPKAFRIGLVLFLIGHIVYGVVLTIYNGFVMNDILIGVVFAILAILIYIFLYSGLGNMKGPVLAYILIITFMISRAVSTLWGDFFNETQAICITIGAGLFYISDLILAISKFKKQLRYNRISLAFYYSGQMFLMISAGLF